VARDIEWCAAQKESFREGIPENFANTEDFGLGHVVIGVMRSASSQNGGTAIYRRGRRELRIAAEGAENCQSTTKDPEELPLTTENVVELQLTTEDTEATEDTKCSRSPLCPSVLSVVHWFLFFFFTRGVDADNHQR
jgi:hypothetical protein